mmetsp:Transcript_30929/g.100712  ORF Transcript_30929/g.100712 Transcript_30929/m.100712 type:complete len:225 (+) Transcript_30929:1740-2414(+)
MPASGAKPQPLCSRRWRRWRSPRRRCSPSPQKSTCGYPRRARAASREQPSRDTVTRTRSSLSKTSLAKRASGATASHATMWCSSDSPRSTGSRARSCTTSPPSSVASRSTPETTGRGRMTPTPTTTTSSASMPSTTSRTTRKSPVRSSLSSSPRRLVGFCCPVRRARRTIAPATRARSCRHTLRNTHPCLSAFHQSRFGTGGSMQRSRCSGEGCSTQRRVRLWT